MKVILCGYHWSGCNALEQILANNYDVYVYTHKAQNSIADLEGLCIKKHIPYSLEKISVDNLPFIPDIICSIYYRYIISERVIELVDGKAFNLHPALLPKYRGCSSLTWAMINGESECGFSFHYVDAECDTGNIIIQRTISIEDYDTQLTLYHKVMFNAMLYFEEAFQKVIDGYKGERQVGVASYYKRGCPLDGILTDEMDDDMQERFIRAMIYPPYSAATYKGHEIFTINELNELKNKLYNAESEML